MERISAAIARAKQLRGEGGAPRRDPAPTADPPRRDRSRLSALDKLPRVRLDPVAVANSKVFAFDENDPRSSRFDILRTQVLQGMAAGRMQTVGVSSPTNGCGKTVVALNLAMSMARQTNHPVILVDLDMKKPAVARYLHLPSGSGLEAFMAGRAELAEVMVRIDLVDLVVVPTYSRVPGSTEVIMSDRTLSLIGGLKGVHENAIVVFDLPPLLETDDAIAVLPRLDCSLLVVAEGMTTPDEIKECSELLQSGQNLGVVYNMAASAEKNYYHYKGY